MQSVQIGIEVKLFSVG